jgi:hypothetical protein
MRTCPRCGLLSPDKSVYCECGFDLVNDVRSELGRERIGWRASAKRQLWTGVAVAGLGAAASLATYLAAELGARFYIFTGLTVVGIGLAWRASGRLRQIRDVEANDTKSNG